MSQLGLGLSSSADNPFLNNDTQGPDVSVTIGDINLPDANKFEQDGIVWTDYQVRNTFTKDLHRYMAGVTSPNGFKGNSAAFFQLSAPTLLWICEWTACCFATQPVIPDSTPKNTDWILLDEDYTTAQVGLGPDGVTPIYRISGVYIYGHRNPNVKTVKDVTYPRAPWLQDTFDRTQPESKLQQGLTETQGSLSLLNPIQG